MASVDEYSRRDFMTMAGLLGTSVISTGCARKTEAAGDRTMTEAAKRANAQRNKESYLKAKAAFNEKDIAGCMSYYALDHQIRSRPVGPGREHIEQFLSAMDRRQHERPFRAWLVLVRAHFRDGIAAGPAWLVEDQGTGARGGARQRTGPTPPA
jgi:hypothetical protein